MNKQKINLLYARLSKDDGEDGVSNSISHQFDLLREYAERNGFTPYETLQDDGYSGTNFNRPGWQELVTRIENGEVATLILKDSSRMARNYLQAGLYRQMFHEKGVRLICVNDGTDTALGEDEFAPFREIMAEWYARDTSKKIKSMFATKGKSGKPISSQPPYGFIKDPNDKYKWLVDPEAAEVVKRVFQMTIDGLGVHRIAGILAAEKIERPSYYLGSRGIGRHKNDYDRDQPYAWGSAMIANILRHPEYAGHTVNFRTAIENFKTKKVTRRSPDDWMIFPNTHEAIVPQETFDLVQKLRETPRRIDHLGEANPLTGLLWCADCGAKLYNHRKAHMAKPTHTKLTDIYCCSTYKLSNSKFHTRCSAHQISTEAARGIILDVLRKTSGYVREHEADFIERVRESFAIKQGENSKSYQKQIAKNERRLAEIDKVYRSLYEDKALGKIGGDMFDQMAGGYEQERAELLEKAGALQSDLDRFTLDSDRAEKFIKLVHSYTNFDVLTNAMLNEFIDRVVVHEGKWSEGRAENGHPMGSRTQRVDVYLKYIGSFDVPDTRTPEQIEADRIAEEKIEKRRTYYREKTRQWAERKRAAAAETKPAA